MSNKSDYSFNKIFLKRGNELFKIVYGNSYEHNIANKINEFRDTYERMHNRIENNLNCRRQYCKAALGYCEITQDWGELSCWLKAELEICNDFDSSWLYYGLGRYLEETGEFSKSIESHNNGIKVSIKNEDSLFLALNYLGLGIVLQRYDKNFFSSEDALLKALNLFGDEKLCIKYQQANTLMNLGSCYDRFEKREKAFDCYDKSNSILREIGNEFDLGRSLYSLGIAYLNDGRLSEANDALNEGLILCNSSNNLYFQSLCLYGIGWQEYKNCEYTKSCITLEKSIDIYEDACETRGTRLSFPESEGNIYLLAAAAYIKNPDYKKALGIIEKYLHIAEKAYNLITDNNEDKLFNVEANRARLYKSNEDWENATASFIKLLNTGKRNKWSKKVSNVVSHLIHIYWKKSALFSDWIELLYQIGFLGFWYLLKGYVNTVLNKLSRIILNYCRALN